MSIRIYAKEEGGLTPYQVMQREDILNTVTSDATDKALSAAQGKRLAEASIETWWHTKVGNVHQFTGSGTTGKVRLRDNYFPGDTFTVNGTPVTVVTGGQPLRKWLAWRWALVIYDASYLYMFTGDAPDIRRGSIAITAPANGVASIEIVFDPPFTAVPIVVVSPYTGNPRLISASVSTTGVNTCTIWLSNETSSAYTSYVRWIAVI